MALRAIVFDLFDTLVDLHWERLPETRIDDVTLRGSTPRLHEITRQFVPLELESFADELKQSDKELFETTYRIGVELPTLTRFQAFAERLGVGDEGFPQALCDAHMGLFRSVAEAPPHHRELLSTLAREFRVGVCSNFSHSETALDLMEEAGLRESLHAIVISDRNGFRKPRPEIFAEVLERLGSDPAETLHVGDSLNADVAGAAGARINTGWLTRRIADPEAALSEYAGPEPDFVLADLAELVPLVRT